MKSPNIISQKCFGNLVAALLALVLLISAAPSARAQIYIDNIDQQYETNWTTTDWSGIAGNPTNGIPGAGTDVTIGFYTGPNTGPQTLTVNYAYYSANALNSLIIDSPSGVPLTLVQTPTSPSMDAATEVVGYSETGDYQQSGSTNTTGNLILANNTPAVGTYELSGYANLTATSETIGVEGTATFTQSGNSYNSTSSLSLGINQSSNAVYNLQSGTLQDSGNETIGVEGTGTITQGGGANTALIETIGYVALGAYPYGVGTYQQSAGTNTISTTLALGSGAHAVGTYNLNGSGILNASNETIGDGGMGTFTQYGNSTNTLSGNLILANQSGSNGSYTLGHGALQVNGLEIIGDGGTATFTQGGGTNTISSLTIGAGSSYIQSAGIENGDGTPTLTVGNAPGSFVVQSGGSYQMSGAGSIENGYVQNQGSFSYSGGTFNGTLENDATGTFSFGSSFNAGQGILNYGTITVGTSQTLGSSASGTLDNEASLALSGGTLGGAGAIINDATLTGYGTLGGTGGFTNNGTMTQGAGLVTLSNTGTNTNNGEIDLTSGQQFRITGTTLTNEGTFDLNTAAVLGTGTLFNDYAGNINGPGTISSSSFTNNGTIAPGNGQVTITQAWTNNGLAELTGITSSIKGGAISNNGTIQGFGTVGSAVTNAGTVEAIGGTLNLSGAVSNQSDGSIYAGASDKVLVTQGLATNAGLINISGGTFDNNSHALTNTGEISGYGTFRTGGTGLTTSGSVTFAGGSTTVNGAVTQTGGTVNTYNPTLFTSAVSVNGGTFTSHETQTTFAGGLNVGSGGTYNDDPGPTGVSSLTVAPGGAIIGGSGASFAVTGDVTNGSTGNQLSGGSVELAAGGTGAHNFTWSVNSGFTDIGTLSIDSGQTVDFSNGGNSGAALYVLSFQLAAGLGAANPMALQADINTALSGDLTIYYDPTTGGNSYLDDMTYTLPGGGVLEAGEAPDVVPEPSTWALLLGGLGLLAFWRARRAAIC